MIFNTPKIQNSFCALLNGLFLYPPQNSYHSSNFVICSNSLNRFSNFLNYFCTFVYSFFSMLLFIYLSIFYIYCESNRCALSHNIEKINKLTATKLFHIFDAQIFFVLLCITIEKKHIIFYEYLSH